MKSAQVTEGAGVRANSGSRGPGSGQLLHRRPPQSGLRSRSNGGHERGYPRLEVEIVIQAHLLAARAPNATGRVYKVACGQRTSLLDLVAALNSLLGTDIPPFHLPPRPVDVTHSKADISRARQDLSYTPVVGSGPTQGLRMYLNHLQRHTEITTGTSILAAARS